MKTWIFKNKLKTVKYSALTNGVNLKFGQSNTYIYGFKVETNKVLRLSDRAIINAKTELKVDSACIQFSESLFRENVIQNNESVIDQSVFSGFLINKHKEISNLNDEIISNILKRTLFISSETEIDPQDLISAIKILEASGLKLSKIDSAELSHICNKTLSPLDHDNQKKIIKNTDGHLTLTDKTSNTSSPLVQIFGSVVPANLDSEWVPEGVNYQLTNTWFFSKHDGEQIIKTHCGLRFYSYDELDPTADLSISKDVINSCIQKISTKYKHLNVKLYDIVSYFVDLPGVPITDSYFIKGYLYGIDQPSPSALTFIETQHDKWSTYGGDELTRYNGDVFSSSIHYKKGVIDFGSKTTSLTGSRSRDVDTFYIYLIAKYHYLNKPVISIEVDDTFSFLPYFFKGSDNDSISNFFVRNIGMLGNEKIARVFSEYLKNNHELPNSDLKNLSSLTSMSKVISSSEDPSLPSHNLSQFILSEFGATQQSESIDNVYQRFSLNLKNKHFIDHAFIMLMMSINKLHSKEGGLIVLNDAGLYSKYFPFELINQIIEETNISLIVRFGTTGELSKQDYNILNNSQIQISFKENIAVTNSDLKKSINQCPDHSETDLWFVAKENGITSIRSTKYHQALKCICNNSRHDHDFFGRYTSSGKTPNATYNALYKNSAL